MGWIGPNNDKWVMHLEIDRKTYWALVKAAADHEQHPEEYLETYINEHPELFTS